MEHSDELTFADYFNAEKAGYRSVVFDIRKIAPFNSHYFGQHLARQVLCFPRSFHIRAESFKAGAIFNFRHITSPISLYSS